MLNNLKRRALTLLLSLAMIITYMPTSMIAYAVDGEEDQVQVEQQVEAEKPAEDVEAPKAEQPGEKASEEVKSEETKSEETAAPAEEKASEDLAKPADKEVKAEAKAEAEDKDPLVFDKDLETVAVKVTAPADAFSEKVELVVKQLDKANKEDKKAFEEAEEALAENKQTYDGILAFDIHFEDGKGKEVEPDGAVSVEMTAKKEALKGVDPKAIDADSIQVTHISSDEATVVADNADKKVEGTVEVQTTTKAVEKIDAEFVVDGFSTYTLTWTEGETEKIATIHWGTYVDETFEELAHPTSIDSSAATVKLDVVIDAEKYYFVGAVYKTSEDAEGKNLANTTLTKKTDGTWQIKLEGEQNPTTVANGSHIYVNYAPYGEGGYNPPPKPTGVDTAPETSKTVTYNNDGTYTIQLDVLGHEDESVTQIGANVIVVMDVTQSMTNDMPGGGGTRMAAAKTALTTLVNTLEPDKNLINFTAVNFAISRNGATLARDWTTQKSDMLAYVNGLPDNPGDMGTNWKAGLQGGISRVNNAASSPSLSKNETYVIFVTDGNPNCYTDNNGNWHGSTGPGFNQQAYNAAVQYANTLGSSSNFYGVFVGDDAGYDHLDDLISGAGGVETINGRTTSAVEEAFHNIAQTIVDNLGAGNVVVDDGIPTLSNVSANVSATVVDEEAGFEYYITPKNGTQTKWDEAPGASYSNDNGVTWNLSEAGTLKDGWTYTVKFIVWPSQAAYDLIADLNNGLKDYEDLTKEQKETITGSKETGYTLKTNTHLYTSFKDLEGNPYRDVINATGSAMDLPTNTISVKKIWPENLLDEYGAATYRGEDGKEHTATQITLGLTKDEEDYMNVVVKGDEGWKKDDIYISCGLMTVKDGVVTVKETGHDYTVTEPEAFSYYWDLIADVYHPMVINGTDTMLILVDPKDAPSAMGDNDVYTAGGITYYRVGGKVYKALNETSNTLEANNYRRSNLNLTKEVPNVSDNPDDTFTYTVKVEDANSTDGKVWFSAWDGTDTYKGTDWVISGATAEEGNTGYWYAENGATVTFKIKAGWNVRFLNLYHGSTFEFTELDTTGYSFEKVEGKTTYPLSTTESWNDINPDEPSATVKGTIIEPNNSYTLTYTNKQLITSVPGVKTWQDGNGQGRAQNITITVSAIIDGVETAESFVIGLAAGEGVDVVATQEGNVWNFVIDGLRKYDSNGDLIIYTIAETAINGTPLDEYNRAADYEKISETPSVDEETGELLSVDITNRKLTTAEAKKA